jgi:hypothetical protein
MRGGVTSLKRCRQAETGRCVGFAGPEYGGGDPPGRGQRSDVLSMAAGVWRAEDRAGEAAAVLAAQAFQHDANLLLGSQAVRWRGLISRSERPLCRRGSLVKLIFELLIDAAKTFYNLSCPIDVLLPALDGPICWRTRRNRTEITRLIGELENLSSGTLPRCSFSLFVLPFSFRQAFDPR